MDGTISHMPIEERHHGTLGPTATDTGAWYIALAGYYYYDTTCICLVDGACGYVMISGWE